MWTHWSLSYTLNPDPARVQYFYKSLAMQSKEILKTNFCLIVNCINGLKCLQMCNYPMVEAWTRSRLAAAVTSLKADVGEGRAIWEWQPPSWLLWLEMDWGKEDDHKPWGESPVLVREMVEYGSLEWPETNSFTLRKINLTPTLASSSDFNFGRMCVFMWRQVSHDKSLTR